MKWHSVASNKRLIEEAVAECAVAMRQAFDEARPHIAFVFVSPHYKADYERVPGLVNAALDPLHLIGSCGDGIIGGGREWETEPSVSMTVAILPDVLIRTFHYSVTDERDLQPGVISDAIGLPAEEGPAMVLLVDPFTFPAEVFLNSLDTAFPFSQKVGGLVSGGNQSGRSYLFQDEAVHREGLVGVGFQGNLAMDTLVSQGCRAVGSPMFVTSCKDNIIQELDNQSPREVLHRLYGSLDADDRNLFSQALFVGVEMRPEVVVNDQADFLIRNIIRMDQTGRLEVAAGVVPNQVVQFHLRDRRASAEDLVHQLTRYSSLDQIAKPMGALLFSCLGRGRRFFDTANHDSELFFEHLGRVPLGGFFCNGEIGPVQGATFVHGYTSCFGLFRPRQPSP